MNLSENIRQHPLFSQLPMEKREIFLRLAEHFEDNDLALYLTPQELVDKLGIGSRQNWQDFLSFEPVKHYINAQVGFDAQVNARRAMKALANEAVKGDTTAARQINDLAGLFEKRDDNKVIILHQIKRPKEEVQQ